MKKIVCFVLAGIWLLGLLGGCRKKPTDTNSQNDTQLTTSSTQLTRVEGNSELTTVTPIQSTSGASVATTKQQNDQSIRVKLHAQTDFTPVGLYGFSRNCIIVLGEDGYFPVNVQGKRLGRDTYAQLYSYREDGYALAQTKDDEWVWLDTDGVVVSNAQPPQSQNNTTEKYDSSETNGAVGEDGEYLFGVKDSANSRYYTEPIFSWISGVDDTLNFAVLAKGEHRNVMISQLGAVKMTLPDDCTHAFARDEHIICQRKDRSYYLADAKGKPLNTTSFTSIGSFSDGLAVVTNGNKLGLIAADGIPVYAPQFNVDASVDQLEARICNGYIACLIDGKLAILKIEK